MDETEAVARALAPEAFGQPFDQCRFYAQEACRIFARTAIAALEEYRARDEQVEAEDFLRRVEEPEGETPSEKYRAFMRHEGKPARRGSPHTKAEAPGATRRPLK